MFGCLLGCLGFFGGRNVFLRHASEITTVWQSVHRIYQFTFSTSELLRVDNHIANGCSAATEFTGSSASLCV